MLKTKQTITEKIIFYDRGILMKEEAT